MHFFPIKMFKFQKPCTAIVCGPSFSGKSTWISLLIKHRRSVFEEVPVKIYYFYSEYQPLFDEIKKTANVTFIQGLPDDYRVYADENRRHVLTIIDDLGKQASSHSETEQLFTAVCHHYNMSAFLLLHNLYTPGKNLKTISLSARYYIVFKSPRDQVQIRCLGTQMYTYESSILMDAYFDAVSYNKGYLLIDLSSNTDDRHRLRTHIWPDQDGIIYEPIRKRKEKQLQSA